MKSILTAILMTVVSNTAYGAPTAAEQEDWVRVKASVMAQGAFVTRECNKRHTRCVTHWFAKGPDGRYLDALEIVRPGGHVEHRSCLYEADGSTALCRFMRPSGRIEFRPIQFIDGKWVQAYP
jgi:hypothetical protein